MKISENPATCYFFDYWEDLWTGISSKRDLLTSFNPRVVIRELLDEITLNKVNNNANEAFFKRTLGNYLKSDPGSSRRLKIYLQMILKEMDLTKTRPHYLPKLCHSALKVFEDYEYFEDCLTSFFELIEAKEFNSDKKDKIRQIVNHLIVEFREIGYTDKEIHRFPGNIFSNIKYPNDSLRPYWDFPHEIPFKNYDDKKELEIYRRKLEDLQLGLTETDRINAILTIAKKNNRSINYIFQVFGMANISELKIAGTLFYYPQSKRLMIPDTTLDPENIFEVFGTKDECPINASVTVRTISSNSGEMNARSKVEKSFGICRRVMDGNSRLRLSRNYLTLDVDGKILSYSPSKHQNDDDDPKKQFSKGISFQDKLDIVEKARSIAETNGWGKKFDESCYWLRRAEESESYVDKLLSYWICIETLCAKNERNVSNWFETKANLKETDIYLIKQVVGKLYAVGKCYEQAQMVYHHLSWLIKCPPFIKTNNICIPNILIKNAQLDAKEGEEVLLKNIIIYAEEIKNNLPEGLLLRDQLDELHSFYTDNKIALTVLQNHLQNTQDELAFIYRMRNKIAHDGNSEHPLLPSLCKFAEEYAIVFFNQIVNSVVEEKEFELDSVLIMAVQKYDLIEMRLQTEDPKDIFLN